MSNRKLYREIAKQHGVSVQEVKRDMQEALNHAYNNANNSELTKSYQNQVPRSSEVPTPVDFISYAVNRIKSEENQEK